MPKMQAEEVRRAADLLVGQIHRLSDRPLRFMEVCGTHTVAIFRSGIRQILPPEIELVSGPGCPVCVTPNRYLDTAIAYSRQQGVIIATFGDMLRVPGSSSSLQREKAEGADVRIVYSPLDAVAMAQANPDRKVIFLAVGFETTAPTAAAAVLSAQQAGLKNFFVISAHKLVPPALAALLQAPETKVDGFLLPGHVSAVIGIDAPYRFLTEQFHTPAVVAGFEPLEILQAVLMLLRQVRDGAPRLENAYGKVVRADGNPVARKVLYSVYETAAAEWRGIGSLPGSGLAVKDGYRAFDAAVQLPVTVEETREPVGCRCGEVLRGVTTPANCPLFGKVCTPDHPVGSCMVSVEGSCAAWYKYGSGRWQL